MGCDQGDPQTEPAQGPPVGLVATFPADGAGTECLPGSPDECGVPIDTMIELRFDRFLLPASTNRQAIALYTGEIDNRVGNRLFQDAPKPVYDVVERVVTIRLAEGQLFEPRTLYTVELVAPTDEQPFGFRAVDGAPVGAARHPLRFSFYTSGVSEVPPATDAGEPAATCTAVLTWFSQGLNQGSCTTCHGEGATTMGLELQSGTALLSTAIGQVAHQTDLGRSTGERFENSPRFGVGMPIIDSGQPNNSYLLYKLLIKPENFRRTPSDAEACETTHRVAVGEECLTPSAEEISRLRNWFVRGEAMPLSSSASLYRSKLLGIQSWIRDGASCE